MIVYVGNKLSRHGSSINFMELLVPRLAEHYQIKSGSDKKNKIFRMLSMLCLIWRNRRKCTIVFIDTYSTTAFWYAYWSAKLCQRLSIPYVPVLHGGNLPERYSVDRERCDRFLSSARHIVVPSLFLDDFFRAQGFSVNFIPNFIEIGNYEFKSRTVFRPRILWVRAFHTIYNPSLAVEVIALLFQKYPDCQLCMVGADKDGSLATVQHSISANGLDKRIKITGILSKAQWIDLSKNYDFFLNTTTIDNMPVSVIEAMALGMPIISTNVGGIPFLIEDEKEGILTPSGDAKSMALAIEMLIDNPDYAARLAHNARRKVEAFDWDVVKQKWFDIIDSASV